MGRWAIGIGIYYLYTAQVYDVSGRQKWQSRWRGNDPRIPETAKDCSRKCEFRRYNEGDITRMRIDFRNPRYYCAGLVSRDLEF